MINSDNNLTNLIQKIKKTKVFDPDLLDDLLNDLSKTNQNYLKSIWNLSEHSNKKVSTSTLAETLKVANSTVSESLKKLAEAHLIYYAPYSGASLTPLGEKLALFMVRRHRIIETYLVAELGYHWDQIHQEADELEHAVSKTLIDKMEWKMGYPKYDPHGDPIPTKKGTIPKISKLKLSDLTLNSIATVVRISDVNPDVLRLLDTFKIRLGTKIKLETIYQTAETVTIKILNSSTNVSFGKIVANAIWVELNSN